MGAIEPLTRERSLVRVQYRPFLQPMMAPRVEHLLTSSAMLVTGLPKP